MTAHDYEPTHEDINWARGIVATVKDGGTLVMPGTVLVWAVHHSTKTIVLINSERLGSHLGRTAYLRTKATFERIGYTVAPS